MSTIEKVQVDRLALGDVLRIEDYIGTVTMLDTYNLGAGPWPCVRIFLTWGDQPRQGRGFARFPHEFVERVR